MFDEGEQKWYVIDRELRDDLRDKKDFVVELIGDESASEIEQYVGVASDPATDEWFKRKERPKWEAINKWINDEYERRRDYNQGRKRRFPLYVPNKGA